MKLTNLFQSLVCLLTTACQSFVIGPDQPGYYAIFSYGEELKSDYGLRIVGFGGGTHEGKDTLNITLMGQQTPTRDEARAIFYDVTERFLERINSNEKLLELNFGNIYTIANLDISFIFPNVENYTVGIGNGYVDLRDHNQYVYFFTYDAQTGKSPITYKEPYEELKRIVEQQRCSSQYP